MSRKGVKQQVHGNSRSLGRKNCQTANSCLLFKMTGRGMSKELHRKAESREGSTCLRPPILLQPGDNQDFTDWLHLGFMCVLLDQGCFAAAKFYGNINSKGRKYFSVQLGVTMLQETSSRLSHLVQSQPERSNLITPGNSLDENKGFSFLARIEIPSFSADSLPLELDSHPCHSWL